MKIYPSKTTPNNFNIFEISAQELKNIVSALEKDYIMRDSPWSKGTREQLQKAIEESFKYHYCTGW